MSQDKIIWKTKKEYYDIDGGFQISQYDATTNYIIIKTEKNAYIQNGHGTITYTHQCKRIYIRDLFSTPNE